MFDDNPFEVRKLHTGTEHSTSAATTSAIGHQLHRINHLGIVACTTDTIINSQCLDDVVEQLNTDRSCRVALPSVSCARIEVPQYGRTVDVQPRLTKAIHVLQNYAANVS